MLFKSTQFGDDVDRPLTKSDGSWTYFATDCAYHYEKYKRKFFTIINVWGADHGGYIKRIKGIIDVLSSNKVDFQVKLCQLVNVTEDGEKVKMSKREGNFISLASVINSVGPDVIRFIMLTRKNDASLDFDIEKVTEQSNENPVYYVQYAHARICSILRLSRDKNITYTEADLKLLQHQSEISLIHKLFQFPDILETIARNYEPHHMTHYSLELATAFHNFYQQCRVISYKPSDIDLTKARLKLADATRVILNRALTLMSMSAPEKM